MCSTIIGWGGGYNLHLAAKRQECYNYVRMPFWTCAFPQAPQREKSVSRFFHTSASEKL
jgi:hypothetical protein